MVLDLCMSTDNLPASSSDADDVQRYSKASLLSLSALFRFSVSAKIHCQPEMNLNVLLLQS